MKTQIQALREQLEQAIAGVDPESSPVKAFDQCARLVADCIKQIRQFIAASPFADKSSEIYYFKHVCPYFYSKYIFFVKRYNAELFRITSDIEGFRLFLEEELAKVNTFCQRHGDLHRYYYSNSDCMDEILFTGNRSDSRPDKISILIGDQYCASSVRVSKILAYEKYRQFIAEELSGSSTSGPSEKQQFTWKAKKTDAVELIVSLHESKIIFVNGHAATMVQIKEAFERWYNIDLKDFSILDNSNRSRKKEDTPFLSQLIISYITRKDRLLG